nr:unnamed protein product [Digitaria exilis]
MSKLGAAATAIEHTFVVSQVNMTRLCNETLVTVVNGQFPGPMVEVTEGDSVAVHVVNKSPYNLTIHWHGVKQRLNCWADGVPMITQCPIRPCHNFTYRFNITVQQGTLWWHAHVTVTSIESVAFFHSSYGSNAVLTSEHYLKIAGHKLTVVAADANYVTPYTTDTVAIAPGQTLDALLVADAPPRRSYYMVSMGSQPTLANPPPPVIVTRGTVQYRSSSSSDGHEPAGNGVPLPPMVPDMPDLHDTATSFNFHGNLTSLHKSRVSTRVDEHLLIVLSAGSICWRGHRPCKRSGDMESNVLVTMNNISFELPAAAAATTPLLESHYYHRNEPAYVTLPDRPQRAFNFADHALIPFGPKEAALEPTGKATTARRFRHGMAVEVVFQNTAVMQSDYNPMHLHGHDMFVVT